MFVSLEGIDGSGKTSIGKMMKELYESKGKKVYLTEEPTRIIFDTKSIMEKDLDPFTRAFIFMADRVEHLKVIKEKISQGFIVICDRYVDSTFAYQGSALEKRFGSKDRTYEYLLKIYEPVSLDPDIVIYLDVEPEIGLKRIESRKREIFEKISELENVREFYLYLSKIRNYRIYDSNKDLKSLWQNILSDLNL
ncbi:MAG: dTMP kinase [Thermoplasmata archaeon]|nr:dTMP kinase [Thermoplasmata archaeon]